jgi:Fe-S cluster assembly ATP-binding protein
MLELQNISYAVRSPEGNTDILKNIDLIVQDNRLIVFTGPNGGGKTTLAKIIMGLVMPTEGRILWNGQDVTELGITERARLGISYGVQQPPRFKGLKVRDLLSWLRQQDSAEERGLSLLTQVGLCANNYMVRDVDVSCPAARSGNEIATSWPAAPG